MGPSGTLPHISTLIFFGDVWETSDTGSYLFRHVFLTSPLPTLMSFTSVSPFLTFLMGREDVEDKVGRGDGQVLFIV